MKFRQLYSGSQGNAYLVTSSTGQKMLIECGVTWKNLLSALNYDLSGIECCLITHHHKDHCKAINDVLKAGIDCYASKETWLEIRPEQDRRSYPLLEGCLYDRNGFRFRAFSSNHDTPGSLLFVIEADEELMLFATDTAYLSQGFKMPFNIIAIECSYDKDVLMYRVENKKIDEALAKRLLNSHMSRSEAKRYLRAECNLSLCREIHLLHLSSGNMADSVAEIKAEFEDAFMIQIRTVQDEKN